MTIYGIKIKNPHSSTLTRSEAMSCLKNALRNEGFQGELNKGSFREFNKDYSYNILRVEDRNNFYTSELGHERK